MLNLSENPLTPINIGNSDEFTMIELANKIISATNSDSKLVFESLPSDDPKQRRPDITKARDVLKWSPTIDLNE